MTQIMNWLIVITLIEMMVAIGLGVSWPDLMRVAKDRRLILAAAFTNYVCVPAATVMLLPVFNSRPLAAVGFLILAACPGASYGPPITAFAKGRLPTAVGLMVLLAGSSAFLAPLLLQILLPLLSDQESLRIDLVKMFGVLIVTQFAPLCLGLAIRSWCPTIADKLRSPAHRIGIILNICLVGGLLATHLSLFGQLDLRGFLGMSALLVVSLSAGWIFGGPGQNDRRALALATSLRNVGLSLVIATSGFPETQAVTVVLGYGFFEILGSLLLAGWWRKTASKPFGAHSNESPSQSRLTT